MFHRCSRSFVSAIALCTPPRPVPAGGRRGSEDLSGWAGVLDPSRDCEVSLDVERAG